MFDDSSELLSGEEGTNALPSVVFAEEGGGTKVLSSMKSS